MDDLPNTPEVSFAFFIRGQRLSSGLNRNNLARQARLKPNIIAKVEHWDIKNLNRIIFEKIIDCLCFDEHSKRQGLCILDKFRPEKKWKDMKFDPKGFRRRKLRETNNLKRKLQRC